MTAWMVLSVILILFCLLLQIRVGGAAEYCAEGLRVWLRFGFFRVKIFPIKEKKAKKPPKREKQKQKNDPEATPGKPGGSLGMVRQFLPLIGEAAGELKRRIRVDKLYLDLATAAADPALAALAFGGANAMVGMIWPIFEQNFEVKDHRIRTAVDFQSSSPTVYLYAALSGRLGQWGSFAIRYAVKFLKLYRREKKSVTTQKEAI